MLPVKMSQDLGGLEKLNLSTEVRNNPNAQTLHGVPNVTLYKGYLLLFGNLELSVRAVLNHCLQL